MHNPSLGSRKVPQRNWTDFGFRKNTRNKLFILNLYVLDMSKRICERSEEEAAWFEAWKKSGVEVL